MHSYFANLYEIECVSQHYHRTLENISIWDITEYMEASLAACEGMWLRKLLSGLFECELEATVVHCDNQSGIRLSEIQCSMIGANT